MDKWADYYISEVRYNSKKTHIEKVKVHEDLGTNLGSPSTWEREDVLDSLRNDESFCTITLGKDNNWKKGAPVLKVTIGEEDYIKTKNDSIKEDNLGSLPTF
jgi:hypothetical protein